MGVLGAGEATHPQEDPPARGEIRRDLEGEPLAVRLADPCTAASSDSVNVPAADRSRWLAENLQNNARDALVVATSRSFPNARLG